MGLKFNPERSHPKQLFVAMSFLRFSLAVTLGAALAKLKDNVNAKVVHAKVKIRFFMIFI